MAKPVAGKTGTALVDADTGALVPDSDEAARAVRLMTELADRYGSSDVLNAHALVAFTAGRIKYASGLGFYVWNGVTWERSETRVRQAIHYMGQRSRLPPLRNPRSTGPTAESLRTIPGSALGRWLRGSR
ncbi:hypothetical protein [Streptomyces reniochalinae]